MRMKSPNLSSLIPVCIIIPLIIPTQVCESTENPLTVPGRNSLNGKTTVENVAPTSNPHHTKDTDVMERRRSTLSTSGEKNSQDDYVNNTKGELFNPICPYASCVGKCGRSIEEAYRMCACDSSCEDYGDCCPDYWKTCSDYNSQTAATTTEAEPVFILPKKLCGGKGCYSCITYRALQPNVYAVNRCPVDFHEGFVKDRCNKADKDKLVDVLPIFHEATKTAYINIYCVVCHGIPITETTVFEHEIGCRMIFANPQDNGQIDSKDYFLSLPFENITLSELRSQRCNTRITKPMSVRLTSRICVRTDVEECPEDHSLTQQCNAFAEPWSFFVGHDFYKVRNHFCFECNEYSMNLSDCVEDYTDHFQDGMLGQLRFSILFDFTALFTAEESAPVSTDGISANEEQEGEHIEAPWEDYGFLSGRPGLYFLNFSGRLQSQDSHDTVETIFLYTYRTIPELYNITVTTATYEDCQDAIAGSRCWITSFEINGLINETANLYMTIVNSTRYMVESLGSDTSLTISTLKLSNVADSLDQICLSDLRLYNLAGFNSLAKRRKFHLTNSMVNLTDSAVADPISYPMEVKWVRKEIPSNSIYGSQLKNSTEQNYFNQIFSVCGQSAEETCSLQVYSRERMRSLSIPADTSHLLAHLSTVIAINENVMVCSEELEGLINSLRHEADDNGDLVEFLLTVIGCTLSLSGLLITFITYLLFPDLRNLPGKCVMNLVLAMFLAQSLFIFGGLVSWRDTTVCLVTAIFQHFFWLATFSWTNVMAFDLGRTFGGIQSAFGEQDKSKWFWLYFLVAWAVPFLVVILTVCLDMLTSVSVGYGVMGVCWITEANALLLAFILPVSIHLSFNIIAFVYVVVSINKTRQLTEKVQTDKSRRSALVIYTKISVVMGFTWLLGYLGNVFPVPAVWYSFTVLNSCQGLYLFLAFVLNSSVTKRYKGLCCKRKLKMSTITNSARI